MSVFGKNHQNENLSINRMCGIKKQKVKGDGLGSFAIVERHRMEIALCFYVTLKSKSFWKGKRSWVYSMT